MVSFQIDQTQTHFIAQYLALFNAGFRIMHYYDFIQFSRPWFVLLSSFKLQHVMACHRKYSQSRWKKTIEQFQKTSTPNHGQLPNFNTPCFIMIYHGISQLSLYFLCIYKEEESTSYQWNILQCSKLKKKSQLSLFQKLDNQNCELCCPKNVLVAH